LRHGHIEDSTDSEEFNFLHVAAAGNNGSLPAYEGSQYGRFSLPTPGHNYGVVVLLDFSTHLPNLKTAPYLANTLIVEGRQGVDGVKTNLQPVKPYSQCFGEPGTEAYRIGSSYGGHISAIGNMVEKKPSGAIDHRGLYLPFEPPGYYGHGSSFASPQVAGVAALVWTARPDLSMQQVRNILLKTAGGVHTTSDTTPCTAADTDYYHAPVDAYAAVLATDCPDLDCDFATAATPANVPIRLTLLDVAGADTAGNLVDGPDTHFTQADILKFLQEFQSRRGTSFDYSRYDLNGDGATHSPLTVRPGYPLISQPSYWGTRRFDLNGDGQFTTALQTVEGVTVNFDENSVSDTEVLIYYAYSPLYEGNEYERTLLLLPYLEVGNGPDGIKPFLRQMNFQLSNLTGTAGDTALASIYYQGSRSDAPEAGSRGGWFISPCGQERGAPLFTGEVQAAAAGILSGDDVYVPTWWWSVNPINTPPAGAVSKRCSDFVAAVPSTGKMWINIAQVMSNEPNREYQTRLYLGEPDLLAPGNSSFSPGPKRLLTQQGIYGYVDMNAGGNFIGGTPSSDFRLLGIGFQPATTYWWQYRD